jgi:membrane protein implicated in regulation of membrane protease activity
MGLTKWGSLAICVGLLFFTLLFCTTTGFLGSAAWSVVLLVLGVIFLREKPDAAH